MLDEQIFNIRKTKLISNQREKNDRGKGSSQTYRRRHPPDPHRRITVPVVVREAVVEEDESVPDRP
jgi:hypothetical protein